MRDGRAAFLEVRSVSRETLDRLDRFAGILGKWTPAINLIAKSTLSDLWTRHFLDSAQLFDLRPDGAHHWVDLGSGGGFPGLVVAILAAAEAPDLRVTLVESDLRKATFLSTVVREVGLSTKVHAMRIENLEPLGANVLSARALAPLDHLLAYAKHHLAPQGRTLFPKGASHAREMDAALEHWRFDVQEIPSLTDPNAVILNIGEPERV